MKRLEPRILCWHLMYWLRAHFTSWQKPTLKIGDIVQHRSQIWEIIMFSRDQSPILRMIPPHKRMLQSSVKSLFVVLVFLIPCSGLAQTINWVPPHMVPNVMTIVNPNPAYTIFPADIQIQMTPNPGAGHMLRIVPSANCEVGGPGGTGDRSTDGTGYATWTGFGVRPASGATLPFSCTLTVQSLTNPGITHLVSSAFLMVSPATCTSTSTGHWLASTWSAMQTCINMASPNDTVTLGPGVQTAGLNERITIYPNKPLILDGNRQNGTKLYDSVCGGYCTGPANAVFILHDSTLGTTTMENFDIEVGDTWHWGGGVMTLLGEHTPGGKPLRITNNKYKLHEGGGDWMTAYTNYALLDHNEMIAEPTGDSSTCIAVGNFVRIQFPDAFTGSLPDAGAQIWMQPMKWGNIDDGTSNMYIEDNTFWHVSQAVTDFSNNARAVFRFNKLYNTSVGTHGTDSGVFGNRAFEVYGNAWYYDSSPQPGCADSMFPNGVPEGMQPFIYFRGGSMRVIGNYMPTADTGGNFSGYIGNNRLLLQNLNRGGAYGCWTGPRPVPGQIGWGWINGTGAGPFPPANLTTDLEPVVYAGNYGPIVVVPPSGRNQPVSYVFMYGDIGVGLDDSMACHWGYPGFVVQDINNFIQRDREFYEQAWPFPMNTDNTEQTSTTSPFDGTTGTGTGPRAMRPATCTTGVYYWSEDQGNWNHNSDPALYQKQGVLDKCTATNTWTNAFYTPYEYPHPLDLPPGPRMFWARQPSDIETAQAWLPPLEVELRPPLQGHVIQITMGGNCALTGGAQTQVTTDVNGLAVFPGLRPSSASLPQQCRLSAADTTASPAIPTILSVPFNVVGPPPGGFTLSVSTQPQSNLQPFQTFNVGVQIIPPATHALSISVASGTCTLGASSTLTATADAQGAATFSNLVAGNVGSGCVLQISNTTVPAVLPVNTAQISISSGVPGGACNQTPLGQNVTCILSVGVNGGDNDTSITVPGINATGGNFVLVSAAYWSNTPCTLSSTPANTWHPLAPVVNSGYYDLTHRFYYAYNANVSNSMNITFSCASGGLSMAVAVFSGIDSQADPLDQVSGSGADQQAFLGGPAVTPTSANQLAVAGLSRGSAGNGPPADPGIEVSTGFDMRVNVNAEPGWGVNLATRTVGTPEPIQAVWDVGGAGGQIRAATTLATFRTGNVGPMYTLSFAQQPMTIISGNTMAPVIVSTTPTAPNGLTVTLQPNNCSGVDFNNVTGQTFGGTAVFAMIIPVGSGANCTFTALMGGGTSPVSSAFNVTAASVGTLAIVNGGNAYNCLGRTATTAIDMTVQANGSNFSTAGADLIIVTLNSTEPTVNPFSDQVGGVATGNTWTPIFSPVLTYAALGNKQEWWYTHPVATGANASFHVDAPSGATSQVSMCVIALSGAAAMGPVFMTSNAEPLMTHTLNMAHPPGDEFVLTTATFLSGMLTSGPSGFSTPVIQTPLNPGIYGLAAAWKFTNSGTEAPSWTFNTVNPALIVGVMFAPGNAQVMPLLSFQTQPTTTMSGTTMASFVVSVTGGLTGNVTLTPTNCPGVSFSGLVQPISGTTATFSTVIPNGIATGCGFTAAMPGATSAESFLFNVNGIPLGLSFTQQPTDTVNGGAFQPPVAGRKTVQ